MKLIRLPSNFVRYFVTARGAYFNARQEEREARARFRDDCKAQGWDPDVDLDAQRYDRLAEKAGLYAAAQKSAEAHHRLAEATRSLVALDDRSAVAVALTIQPAEEEHQPLGD